MNMKDITFGASLSSKQCRDLNINPLELLHGAMHDLGLKRFRLMSYWDECEPEQGILNFELLDALIQEITDGGGEISLCIGMRQPRYPECHIPQWAKDMPQDERNAALYSYIETVIKRYKNNTAITSWQLENEAYNKGIGECDDYDRARIRAEFELIKDIDHFRPVIMTASNTWAIPFRRPRPDIIGISLYLHQWGKRGLSRRHKSSLYHRVRNWLIEETLRVPVFCHELQMEPWGERATQDLNDIDQTTLLPVEDLKTYINYAVDSGCRVIDMWGLEWWYWRKQARSDSSYWDEIRKLSSL